MSLKEKTILVVDDDEDILKLLKKVLSAAGFRVLSANSPAEGRELINQEAPHVILTDLHMEPENGFQFVQSLRSKKSLNAIPILVFSSLNDFSSVKKAIALGINDYVIKPLQTPMLLRKLRKALYNKDFVKWVPEVQDRPEVTICLPLEIVSLGEMGCSLKGPLKISSGKEIKIEAPEFTQIGLDKVAFKASPLLKTYQNGGNFYNDVTFIGVAESTSSKIRQFLTKGQRL